MIEPWIRVALLLVFPLTVGSALAGVPDTVRPLLPADGDTVTSRAVTFTWERAGDVLWYDLSLSLTADFTSRVDSQRITATTILVRDLPSSRAIYWRIRGVDGSGAGPWSRPWRFFARFAADSVPDTVKPLTELGTGTYQGYMGGLYPEGSNSPPAAHMQGGLLSVGSIVPLDTLGEFDPLAGSIVLLSIGMSNATQEFSVFKGMADTFAMKNPRLVVVDGAQGGQTASVIADTGANFWRVIDQRLRAAGVTPRQVAAVWLKEANAGPTGGFPQYAQDLERDLATIIRSLPARYPHLKVVYLSSRIYAGYATTTLNPEMYAYESGFSVKWLIEKQIGGDTALAYEGASRRAPWLAWGPYLWANGRRPRIADRLIWEPGDFTSDGTHPASSGRMKVARMLLDFMSADPTARLWFLRPLPGSAPGDRIDRAAPLSIHPNPTTDRATITFNLAARGGVRLELVDAQGRILLRILDEQREAGRHQIDIPCVAADGRTLPSGLYYCRLTAGTNVHVDRLVILRGE